MKILLLSNKPPWPPYDGGARATLSMIKGLSYYGARITVLYMNTLKHCTTIDEIPDDYREMAEFHNVDVNTKIKTADLIINLLFSRKPYNLQRFESVIFKNQLKKLLTNEFNIVQCEGIYLYSYYKTIRKFSKAPIILRAHNVENKIWNDLSLNEKNPFKKIYFRILSKRLNHLEKCIINKYNALVAVSQYDLEWFKNNGLAIPSISIHPGFDSSLLHVLPDRVEKKIGFIGSLEWIPNIIGLLWFVKNVWPIVSKKVPGVELHVAGRNGTGSFLEILSDNNIFYHGEVPDSTEFIDDQTIIISPLFAGSGIRIKIIEAMSRGKVVIATSVAVEGMNICPGENILVADSIQMFADNLTGALLDKELRVHVGNNAIEVVRCNYNIFVLARELIKFYSTLIA
jgi:glycosyltransferase involved in cell wall biosynthesis